MRNEAGFTMIEIIIALVILAVAVLGIGASSGSMLDMAGTAEVRARAVQAAEDRIQEIQIDPRYEDLDSLYEGTENDLDALEGFTRVTSVERVQQEIQGGTTLDYQIVGVRVTGPELERGIKRTTIVGER